MESIYDWIDITEMSEKEICEQLDTDPYFGGEWLYD